MNALNGTQCHLQILLPLVCGLHWGCSLAATGYGRGSPLGNRHLSGRLLSPCRLPFWIAGSPLGLKLLPVGIHCYGEHEVQAGGRPERYHNLGSLPHALRELLQLILQHGCGSIPSEVIRQTGSSPGGRFHTVWSLKPRNQRGASGSPVFSMTSLPDTSRKTGCGCVTSTTLLISKMETSMKRVESSLSVESSLDAATCHTFRCM